MAETDEEGLNFLSQLKGGFGLIEGTRERLNTACRSRSQVGCCTCCNPQAPSPLIEDGREATPTAKERAAEFARECLVPGGESDLEAIRARYSVWSARRSGGSGYRRHRSAGPCLSCSRRPASRWRSATAG